MSDVFVGRLPRVLKMPRDFASIQWPSTSDMCMDVRSVLRPKDVIQARLLMLDDMLRAGIDAAQWMQFDKPNMPMSEYGYRHAMAIVDEWKSCVSATCPEGA